MLPKMTWCALMRAVNSELATVWSSDNWCHPIAAIRTVKFILFMAAGLARAVGTPKIVLNSASAAGSRFSTPPADLLPEVKWLKK